MKNAEALRPGTRVKIVAFAVGEESPQVQADRRELVGATGTVVERGLYISVKLDDDKAHLPAAVLCVPSELELLDADTDQARTA